MTLEEVEQQVRIALARINHPVPDFRFDRVPHGDGTPHIERIGHLFDRVIDTGAEEVSRQTVDGEELLFLTLEQITANMSRDVERETRPAAKRSFLRKLLGLSHRATIDDRYSRQTWMDAQERLMRHIRHDWGARVHITHQHQLARYPLTPTERENTRRLDLSPFGVVEDI